MSKKERGRAKHPKPSLFAKTAISAAVAGLLAPLSAAAADKEQANKVKPNRSAMLQQFGLVNLGSEQGLRVNIAFAPPQDPDRPASCDVTATVFAADGSVLEQEHGRLARGQSHVLDFDARTAQALRADVSAVSPPADPGRPQRVTPCEVLSTLEVYDAATGETRVLMLPANEVLIPPSDPGRQARG